MFVGHLGAGLLLKRANREVSLGALFLGAMLLDIVLWVLVLARVESVLVPAHLQSMADLRFDFPYSHGLAASVGWSVAAFLVAWFTWKRFPHAFVISIAVFSHFALDWLVHIPELPVAGRGSTLLGFGLWQHLPLAWGVETALAAAGLWIYLRTQPLSRARTFALSGAVAVVTLMTILGQASKSAPPAPSVMALTSLVMIALLVFFAWWVEGNAKSLAPRPV